MRVLDREQEILTILMEECGEVIQECSKIIRFGGSNENYLRLEKELGDVLCMMDICQKDDIVSWTGVDDASTAKYEKLKKWSHLFNELEK